MRMSKTDLIVFVGDIHTLFNYLAKARASRSDTNTTPTITRMGRTRQNFYKVVVNILSNASNSHPRSAISLFASLTTNICHIAISNDGDIYPR